MRILRTPEHRFSNLRGYPFSPHFVDIDGILRMHYVDEGGSSSQSTVLMLHGEPSWSYLYRHMIPVCAKAGHRVIAPDLIGFGKSDKAADVREYSYQRHVDWMHSFLNQLDLKNITLVCQDWGSLIGLRLAAEQPDRFDRLVIANGFLPTGDQKMPSVFKLWQAFSQYSPWFPISRIVEVGSARNFDKEIRRAYDAPFPSPAYKAGARAFPKLVPTRPDDPASEANRQAWEVLKRWEQPVLTCFSDGDPITRGGDRLLQKLIPGTRGQSHQTLSGGHFLQEDCGPEFARVINQFINDTPIIS
ncbi:haloalkane dehalogenase [gamma proteobacterium HTCC5015]|nr:haloalkane dehalogenase [gamma proteobacterium HTCC5015]